VPEPCCLAGTGDTYARQAKVDAVHYVFQLTLNDENDEITGGATIALRFTGAGVTEVALGSFLNTATPF
jgi:hypothetical protein